MSEAETSVEFIATVTFRSSLAARLSFSPMSALLPSMPIAETAKSTDML